MIQIDGIPRSMYGQSFGAVSYSGLNTSCPGGGAAAGGAGASGGFMSSIPGRPMTAAMPSKIEEDGSPDAGPTSTHAALPVVGWTERLKNRREYTMLKKVVRLLQDNRVQTGDAETAQRLQELNRTQTDSYPILKTILNGIFVTTGVILLVGVVAVVLYTSLVKSCSESDFLRTFLEECNKNETSPQGASIDISSNPEHEQFVGGGDIGNGDSSFIRFGEGADSSDDDDDDDSDRYNVESDQLPASPALESQADSEAATSTAAAADDSELEAGQVKPTAAAAAAGAIGKPSAAATTRKQGGGKTAHQAPRPTATLCRSVPVVYSGHRIVKLGQICFQVPATASSSSNSSTLIATAITPTPSTKS